VIPDRFSINNGTVSNTTGVKLIDDLEWRGVPAASILAPTAVNVTVNWADVQGRVTSESYGLNGYSAVAPSIAAEPQYGQNMTYMSPGLVRYHYARLTRGAATDIRSWVDIEAKTWDAPKIAAALDASDLWDPGGIYRPSRLVTIPTWPSWMKTYSATAVSGATSRTVNDLLDPSEYDAFAAFCAELVRILNIEQKRGIKYFEITNERDSLYYVPFRTDPNGTKLHELVEIYNRAAIAMKQVDPTIQVGGPAFARGDLVGSVRQFVRGTRDNLDFLSYHFYASGDLRDSDTEIYDRVDALARHSRDVVDILREESPMKVIPAHLNEFNISYDFRNNDPRMQNSKGAAFDALSLIAAAQSGVAATNAWNERDGVFGKMDAQNTLRVTGHTYHLFNKYLVGERVKVDTTDAKAVVPYAVSSAAGKSVALVNRSPYGQRVQVESARGNQGLNGSSELTLFEIAADGFEERRISWGELESGRLFLPPHSVTVIQTDARRP